MRNLFVLLLRYHALILFIILEVVSLSFVFSKNSFQRAALRDFSQEIVGGTQNTVFEVTKFFNLGKVNDSLAQELARLKEVSAWQDIKKPKKTRMTLTESSYYQFIPAKVISNSTHLRNNYLTLDIGEFDGVEKNMAIVSTKGVIGIIKGVSGSFSSGISVLHSDFAIGARIKGLNENGTVVWDGDDRNYAILKDIPGHVDVSIGQKVEVNPYSFIFPEGTPIGTIEDFKLVSGQAFYEIKVKLSDDFRNLNHVFVVKNILIEEKEQLEEAVID